MTVYRLQGLDPLVFGDGRPFSSDAGSGRVRTLLVPPPTTVAGALRTAHGRAAGLTFSANEVRELLQLGLRGPLLYRDGQALLPTPACLVPVADRSASLQRTSLVALLPRAFDGGGWDLGEELLPLRLPAAVEADYGEGRRYSPTKENRHRFVTLDELVPFLTGRTSPTIPEREGPRTETRIHVGIQPSTQAARKGFLYRTEGVRLGRIVESAGENPLDLAERPQWEDELRIAFSGEVAEGLIPVGGEGRLARLSRTSQPLLSIPDEVRQALRGTRHVVMILATPAAFGGGWRPDWTKPPGTEGVELKLVAAACGRKLPVSGWDIRARGPKAARWLAPAGSAYFFEVLSGSAATLADAWMQPVSSDPQDRRDGLGSALWGTWSPVTDSL